MINCLSNSASSIIILLFLACLGLSGCAETGKKRLPAHARPAATYQKQESPPTPSASPYAQARSYIDTGQDREAIQRLSHLIKLNNFDQWLPPTSENTADGYFPHRELGIIHYHNREYQKAITELEDSIDSTPSAKAYFYFERAQAERIIKKGLDDKPPKIIFEGSSITEITNSFVKPLKGVAADDTLIKSIRINEQLINLEPPEKTHVFTQKIPLHEGENIIYASTTDLTGKQSKTSLTVIGDYQGPLIEIDNAQVTEKGMSIAGIAKDKSGMISLVINGINWPVTGATKAYKFKFALPLGTVNIVAKDRIGNITQTTLSKENLLVLANNKEEAENTQSQPDKPDTPQTSLAADNKPPRILLEGPIPPENTFNDTITLNFRAIDTSGIHSIFLNKEPILPQTGKMVFFSVGKSLKIGPNNFYVTVFDNQGVKTKLFFTINKNIPIVRTLNHRLKAAVLPFNTAQGPAITANTIHLKLAKRLSEQKRFQVVPNHSNSEPDLLLTGSVNTSSGYEEIAVYFLDAHTKTLVEIVDVFGKTASPTDQEALIDQLADKIGRSFPVNKGVIKKITDNNVTINLGTSDGIKKHSKLIVYRKSAPIIHPVTKSVITPEPEIIGTLQVSTPKDTNSEAKIISKNQPIRVNDRVIIM